MCVRACVHKHKHNAPNIVVQMMEQRRIFTQGCAYRLLTWIENKLDIVGAIALGFAILHASNLQYSICIRTIYGTG